MAVITLINFEYLVHRLQTLYLQQFKIPKVKSQKTFVLAPCFEFVWFQEDSGSPTPRPSGLSGFGTDGASAGAGALVTAGVAVGGDLFTYWSGPGVFSHRDVSAINLNIRIAAAAAAAARRPIMLISVSTSRVLARRATSQECMCQNFLEGHTVCQLQFKVGISDFKIRYSM